MHKKHILYVLMNLPDLEKGFTMKRKPIVVVNDLIIALNTLLFDNEYSINTIAEIADLHWQTTSRYLEIMKKVQDFSPNFAFSPSGKLRIPPQQGNLIVENNDRILIYSLKNEAFNEKAAINIPEPMRPEMEFLAAKNFGQKTSDGKFFINQRGKEMALDALLEIQEKVEKSDSNPILSPFYQDPEKAQKKTYASSEIEAIAEKLAFILLKEQRENYYTLQKQPQGQDDVVESVYGLSGSG